MVTHEASTLQSERRISLSLMISVEGEGRGVEAGPASSPGMLMLTGRQGEGGAASLGSARLMVISGCGDTARSRLGLGLSEGGLGRGGAGGRVVEGVLGEREESWVM